MTAIMDTLNVLVDVADHRAEQRARYGSNDDLEDGTGPNERWLIPVTFEVARQIERSLRYDYAQHSRVEGKPTWMHLVREEVAEAFMESDPIRLRAELIQVAALCVSWIESLDAR